MMEAIDLGFCSEHATSLRAMNLLLWIEPDKNRRRKNKKQFKKNHTHKKKKHASCEGYFASQRNIFNLFVRKANNPACSSSPLKDVFYQNFVKNQHLTNNFTLKCYNSFTNNR